jgi:hypothetical protein
MVKTMLLMKLKTTGAVLVVVLGMAALGGGLFTRPTEAAQDGVKRVNRKSQHVHVTERLDEQPPQKKEKDEKKGERKGICPVEPKSKNKLPSDVPILPAPAEFFPVVAWGGPPMNTIERYRELAEAGFNYNLTAVGTADAAAKALDVAKATGVKQIVCCAELQGNDPEPTVKRFKDHPALGGYYVLDEPSAGQFAKLAAQVKRIQAVDARHPCYVNLFPNYATTGVAGQLGTATYQEYVDRFVREVPVPFLSFDHYPLLDGFGAEAAGGPWYENLELITVAARKADKPVWAFARSVAFGVHSPAMPAGLRLQVYSNLAYGAQVIQYFTYWTSPPDPQGTRFHDGPITIDGKRTVVYDHVKQLNREIQGLRGVFLGSRVLSLGHTGAKLPRGTQSYRPSAPVKEIKTTGQGALVSLLSCAGRRFLVVVNRDVKGPMPVTIELDGSVPAHRVEKNGSLRAIAGTRFEARMEPGDLCVLTWPGKE